MKDPTAELDPEPESPPPEEESGKMSFLEHLDELRRRLIRIILYVLLGFASCFYFSDKIYNFLAVPLTQSLPPGTKPVFTQMTEPFAVYVKVAILAGIFLTIPFTLYEVWKFISPGLYRREKRFVVPFLVSSVILFVTGGAFAYYIVLPRAYKFLLQIGEQFQPMIAIKEYLDLTNTIILGFGLIFEMPVIVAFLSMFGLVTARFLWSKFKYAVLLIFIAAAVLSPTPDAITQCVYAGPMVLLYLISIAVAALFGRRRRARGLD
jgi:sec-independent protein translocase protein TatC